MPVVSNQLWRVRTEAGREYVLKRLPEYFNANPIEEFRVLSFLQGRGVPVVPPIVTDDGQIFTIRNDRHYCLLDKLPHDTENHELGPTAATTSYNVGAAIGRLDRALAECPWQVDSFEDDPPKDYADTLAKLPPEVTNLVDPLTDRVLQAIEDLPTQRTHGDCNTGNVLVHGTEVSGFIDLDHLPLGPRVRDLAYYLVSRVHEHDRAATMSMLDRYVAGYDDAYPLTARERAAIAALMLAIELGGASWHLHGWTPDPAKFQQNVRTVEWLAAHFDELEARCAA